MDEQKGGTDTDASPSIFFVLRESKALVQNAVTFPPPPPPPLSFLFIFWRIVGLLSFLWVFV